MSKFLDIDKDFQVNPKKTAPKRMTEKEMRALVEKSEKEMRTLAEESKPGKKDEKQSEFPFEQPSQKRLTEKQMRAEKQALHELPANYTPPSQYKTATPMVIDRRIVIGVAILCVLFVTVAIGYKVYQNSVDTGSGVIDMQLIMGNNVKRNMDGGSWATLSLPADLEVSDLIKSGSDRRNVIAFPDGTTVRLDYATTIKINSVQATDKPDAYDVHLTLHKGAIFIDEHGDSQVSVETKYARFVPVGTRFGVTQLERKDLTEQSVVNVVEGSVSMNHLDDPDSKIIITAGMQAAATSQSLVKPRKAAKNGWMTWNAKWRDIRSVPTLKGAKLRPGDDPTEDDSSDERSSSSSQPTSASSGADSNGMPIHHQSSQPGYEHSASQPNLPDTPAEPEPQQSSPSGPDPNPPGPNHVETREEREAREVREREEAERQREYDERRHVQEQRINEQREIERVNEEFRKAQERGDTEQLRNNRDLVAPSAPSGKDKLQTGNIVDYQYQHRQEQLKQREAEQSGANNNEPSHNDLGNIAPPHHNGGYVAPSHHNGGTASQNDGMATIGDSKQLDAKIGDSSDMDAKTGSMW